MKAKSPIKFKEKLSDAASGMAAELIVYWLSQLIGSHAASEVAKTQVQNVTHLFYFLVALYFFWRIFCRGGEPAQVKSRKKSGFNLNFDMYDDQQREAEHDQPPAQAAAVPCSPLVPPADVTNADAIVPPRVATPPVQQILLSVPPAAPRPKAQQKRKPQVRRGKKRALLQAKIQDDKKKRIKTKAEPLQGPASGSKKFAPKKSAGNAKRDAAPPDSGKASDLKKIKGTAPENNRKRGNCDPGPE